MEHFTQKSIVLRVEDHCLVEMQHVIVWIGRTVVHGEGRYGEAAGRIVVQDMLTKGVESMSCGPRTAEEKNMCGAGAAPKGG